MLNSDKDFNQLCDEAAFEASTLVHTARATLSKSDEVKPDEIVETIKMLTAFLIIELNQNDPEHQHTNTVIRSLAILGARILQQNQLEKNYEPE